MSVRTGGRTRRIHLAVVALCVVALTACTNARQGSAIPDGDDAAAYVSAKFADTLQALGDDFTGNEPRRSTLDQFVRIDELKMNATITAIQVGSPPSRLSKNHSNRNSDEYLDSFHPAGSPVEYLHLGPVYAELAPTPWVALPHQSGLGACFWEGYQGVCKMLQAVNDSVERGRAAKRATSLPDGTVELYAEVPLREFLEKRVVVIPESLVSRISEGMRKETIPTRILFDPRSGKLIEIEMNGRIAGGGHEFEARLHYQVLDPPTERDLPPIPEPANVTTLSDQAAVDDFYQRMGEIQDS